MEMFIHQTMFQSQIITELLQTLIVPQYKLLLH